MITLTNSEKKLYDKLAIEYAKDENWYKLTNLEGFIRIKTEKQKDYAKYLEYRNVLHYCKNDY